ncbi:MAG: tRNA (adenine(22)-N(1))-methyltransferase TrmK [Clostridium sp.]|nr:tRNA (adenine(22)-N(1))-methyltransferase TrmK [Clostridium sp.]
MSAERTQAAGSHRAGAQEPVLSERMKHVLALISHHKAVADVGCDHGYLAIGLVRSGKAKRVVAMDINRGPLARARANVDAYGYRDVIETRLGDGMEALGVGEVQCAVCAGMGGKTICGILGRSRQIVRELDELVLQPQSELHIVRSYLRENGFLIAAEDMVSEDGKFYPMMRVIPVGAGKEKCAEEEREAVGAKTTHGTEAVRPAADCAAQGTDAEKDADGHAAQESGTEKAVDGHAAQEGRAASEAAQRRRVEDRYGPCLLAGAHPVLRAYLQKERKVCEEVLQNLAQTDSAKGLRRREELKQRISDIAYAEKICCPNYPC